MYPVFRTLALLCLFISPLVASGGHSSKQQQTNVGPNGGQLFHSLNSEIGKFEIFINQERKTQITFINEEGKKKSAPQVRCIGLYGNRKQPNSLIFKNIDGILVSEQTLPKNYNFPAIFSFFIANQPKPESFRIHLNTSVKVFGVS